MKLGSVLSPVTGALSRALKFNDNHVPAGSPEGGQFASVNLLSPSDVNYEGAVQTAHRLEKSLTLYHGAASDIRDSILKDGLVPKGSPGAEEWANTNLGAHFHAEGDRAKSVYAALTKKEATLYAKMATKVHPGSTPVLFQVTVPREKLGEFYSDEMDWSAVRHLGKIPPEWIKEIKVPKVPVEGFTPAINAALKSEGPKFYVVAVALPSSQSIASRAIKFDPNHDEHGRFSTTDDAGFKSWFGDSKVVDESGNPLRVFHGTHTDFEAFDTSKSSGQVWFTSQPGVASGYSTGHNGGEPWGSNIVPLHVSMQNPKVYEGPWAKTAGQWYRDSADSVLQSQGYDGVLFKENGKISTGYVFDPRKVKSAIGSGHDPNDPRITKFDRVLKFNPYHDEKGRFSSSGEGMEMVSPNVEEGLNLQQASQALTSQRQSEVMEAFRGVDKILGLKAEYQSIIGAWADGAENSVMSRIGGNPSYEQLKLSAAMKGMLADQKAVIPFKSFKGGPDTMYRVSMPHTNLQQATEELNKLGLEFHSLKIRNGGIDAFIFDQGSQLNDTVQKASDFYGTQATKWHGQGEFFGSWGTRQEGRDIYQKQIEAHLGPDQLNAWNRLYSDWRKTHAVAKRALKFNPYHDERGRFASGAGAEGLSDSPSLQRSPSELAQAGTSPAQLTTPLVGAPKGDMPPYAPARKAAFDYMKSTGMPYDPPTHYVAENAQLGARIADAFENVKHDPNDPEVKAAYAAFSKEALAQYQYVKASGLKLDVIDFSKQNDPYASGLKLLETDIRQNNHLWLFPTSAGFGSNSPDFKNNPLLAPTNESINGHPLVVNDVFRIVHDFFGHNKEGLDFGPSGEDNAWRSHAAMFSPLARRAMTTETRGQSSWLNFGPYGKSNRHLEKVGTPEDLHYAEQKTGLLPEWASNPKTRN